MTLDTGDLWSSIQAARVVYCSGNSLVDAQEESLGLAGWRGVQVLAAFYGFE